MARQLEIICKTPLNAVLHILSTGHPPDKQDLIIDATICNIDSCEKINVRVPKKRALPTGISTKTPEIKTIGVCLYLFRC